MNTAHIYWPFVESNKGKISLKLTASLLVFLFIFAPFAPVFAKVSAPAPAPPSPSVDLTPSPEPPPTPNSDTPIPVTAELSAQTIAPGLPSNASSSAASQGTAGAGRATGAPQTLQPKTDLNTGALTFGYPIEVPPGRNGLTPAVSLKYNSQKTDNSSIIGYAWEVSIPYIVRKNTHGTDQLYARNDFTSSMDSDLVLTQTAAFGMAFIPQSQSTDFSQYFLDTSTNIWKLITKTGTVLTFGDSTGSREDDPANPAHIFKWMLSSVTDANGNTVTYTYTKDQNKLYPLNINYEIFDVGFALEPRTDASTIYSSGFPMTVASRISEIRIRVSNVLSKKYALTYSSGDNGQRSLLQSVTEIGYDQAGVASALPPTTFNYSARPDAIFNGSSQSIPGLSAIGTSGLITGDINGDAYPDILKAYEWNYYYYTSDKKTYLYNPSANAFQESASFAPPPGIMNYTDNPYVKVDGGTRILDVNGDGKNDLMRTPSSYSNVPSDQEINNGNGWTQTSSYTVNYNSNGGGTLFSEDLNGDALVDYLQDSGLYWNGYSYSYNTLVSLNNGNGFSYNQAYAHTPTFTGSGFLMFDINGDNLPDIISSTITYVTQYPYTYKTQQVYINNGSSWQLDTSYVLPPDFATVVINPYTGQSYPPAIISDFNNDGLNDILTQGNVYLNQGKSFISTSVPDFISSTINNAAVYCNCQNPYLLMDMNADGAQDFVVGGTVFNNSVTTRTDLLNQITLPTGAKAAITYKSSAQYKDASNNLLNPQLPFVVETVSGITTREPISGIASTTQYSYADGFYYVNPATVFDRKFAGFNKVIETDPAGNTTSTFYHQGNASDAAHGEYNDDEWKMGKPYRVEMADSTGNVYSKNINKWDEFDLDNGAQFVKLVQTIDFTFDGNATHNDKAVALTYDNTNGNLIQKLEYGQVNGNDDGTFTDTGTDDFTTVYAYATNKVAHILGLPDYVKIGDHNGSKVKESYFYYDNLPLGQISKGNQTKEEDWKNGTQPAIISVTSPPTPDQVSFSVPAPVRVQALVVGGGGSGGTQYNGGGGGGGAGGFIYDAAHIVEPGSYSITVGAGGVGPQTNGGVSVFDNITAGGGGGGGSSNISGNSVSDGSGGGGSGSGAPGIGGPHGHNGNGYSGNFYPGSGGGWSAWKDAGAPVE